MTQTFRSDGILSTTAMPDGPRRSARIAELSKKRRTSEDKSTKSHLKLGSCAVKGKTGLVKPLGPSQNPPPKEPATKNSRTRGRKGLKRPKDKLTGLEREALSKKGSGRHRVTGQTGVEQARAPERLAAKHLLPQPRQPSLAGDVVRSLEFEDDPQQGIAGVALSRDALRLLETQTANNPLPEELSTFRRTPDGNDMPNARAPPSQPESTSGTTAYNKKFLGVLERHGILEQQFLAEQPVVPDNYRDILTAIGKKREHSPEPSPVDYKKYAETVFNSHNEESVKVLLFPRIFGPLLEVSDGHSQEIGQLWTKGVAIAGENSAKELSAKTNPDYAEGLNAPELPEWVCETAGACSAPGELMAFPNFLVELKRDLSMYTAHAQNRHRGAIASQAYHNYYAKVRGTPDESWAIAKVGSIEFNGDTVVGNLHWVDKTSTGRRRYHMTRILCLFTCGLNFEDFKEARKRARNFRDYFSDVRDKLREECTRLYGQSLDLEGYSTERPNSEHVERQEDPTPGPSTRMTRKRGKGKAPKDPPGRTPKRRRNGNVEQGSEGSSTERPNSEYTERQDDPTPGPSTRMTRKQASVLNKTNLSFVAKRLAL